MRPVNLIPSDQQGAKRGAVGTSAIAYMLVGALALALVGVTLVVLTGNKVSDREAEVTELKSQVAAAEAEAAKFAPFTEFASLEQSRVSTVQNLADSRFDWERTLRELALVIPNDVWLTKLTGAAGSTDPTAAATGSVGGSALAPPGVPSLSLIGCGADQQSVAGFLAALRDIDGVTRVGLSASERSISQSAGGAGDAGGGEDCRTNERIPLFDIVVAFDAVPPPAVPGAAPVAPADAAAASAAATPAGAAPPATESTPTSNTGS